MSEKFEIEYPGTAALKSAMPMADKFLGQKMGQIKRKLDFAIRLGEINLKEEILTESRTNLETRNEAIASRGWKKILEAFEETAPLVFDLNAEGMVIATKRIEEMTNESQALRNRGQYMLACGRTADAARIASEINSKRAEAEITSEMAIVCYAAAGLLVTDFLVQLYERYRPLFNEKQVGQLYTSVCNAKEGLDAASQMQERLLNKLPATMIPTFDFDFNGAFNALGETLKHVETTQALWSNPDIASHVKEKNEEVEKLDTEIESLLAQTRTLVKRIEPIETMTNKLTRIDQEITDLRRQQETNSGSLFKAFRKGANDKLTKEIEQLQSSRDRITSALPGNYDDFLAEQRKQVEECQAKMRQIRSDRYKLLSEIENLEKGVIDFEWPAYARKKYAETKR